MDLNHGIIFKSLWAGSLAGQADPQLVFIFLIAHSDPDDCVDIHPGVISALTGLPAERVRAALDYLESDDPQSRNPDHDGCRIKRLDTHRDWGWMVLNRPAYKALFTKEKKLRADRDRIAGKRSVAKCRNVSPEVASVAQAVGSMQYAVGIEEEESKPSSASADFLVVCNAYPKNGPRSRKAEALRVWKRLTPKPILAEVLDGLARCCASDDWCREGGRFVPGIQVWLRQRGWDCADSDALPEKVYPPHRPEMTREERMAQINRGRE